MVLGEDLGLFGRWVGVIWVLFWVFDLGR